MNSLGSSGDVPKLGALHPAFRGTVTDVFTVYNGISYGGQFQPAMLLGFEAVGLVDEGEGHYIAQQIVFSNRGDAPPDIKRAFSRVGMAKRFVAVEDTTFRNVLEHIGEEREPISAGPETQEVVVMGGLMVEASLSGLSYRTSICFPRALQDNALFEEYRDQAVAGRLIGPEDVLASFRRREPVARVHFAASLVVQGLKNAKVLSPVFSYDTVGPIAGGNR